MSTDESGGDEDSGTYALVVGIEHYRAGAEWKIRGPADDALAFVKWLRLKKNPVPINHIEFLCCPESEEVVVAAKTLGLQVQDPTNTGIAEALQERLRKVKGGKKLYVFWAGHGSVTLEDDGSVQHLYCSDHKDGISQAYKLSNFLAYLKGYPNYQFVEQICFFDVCANYFDRVIGNEINPRALPVGKAPAYGSVNQHVFSASSEGEVAYLNEVRATGRFSEALMQYLNNVSEVSDAGKLIDHLTEYFMKLKEQGIVEQHPIHVEAVIAKKSPFRDGPCPRSCLEIAAGNASSHAPLREWYFAAREVKLACPFIDSAKQVTDLARRIGIANQGPVPLRDGGNTTFQLAAMLASCFLSKCNTDDLFEVLSDMGASEPSIFAATLAVSGAVATTDWSAKILSAIERTGCDPDGATIRWLYERSVVGDLSGSFPGEIDEALFRLTQRVQPHESKLCSPFQQFLMRLQRILDDEEFSKQVDELVSKDRLRKKATDAAIARDRREVDRAYIVLDLNYEITGKLAEEIDCWVYKGDNAQAPERKSLPTDGTESSLLDELSKIVDKLSGFERLQVELFLPCDKLSVCADDWLLPSGGRFTKLGDWAAVTLRWRDRGFGRDGTRADAWRRVAESIVKAGGNLDCEWIEVRHSAGQVRNVVSDEDFARCCNFAFCPFETSRKDLDERVFIALVAGMPFAVWPRQKVKSMKRFRNLLTGLICGPADEIPHKVARAKNDAQEHACNVTLFWDDPDRNPLLDRLEDTDQRGHGS